MCVFKSNVRDFNEAQLMISYDERQWNKKRNGVRQCETLQCMKFLNILQCDLENRWTVRFS